MKKVFSIILVTLTFASCIEEIDIEPMPYVEAFMVEHSIKSTQSYYQFYENKVLEVKTSKPTDWDLAFESTGTGSRILIGWASASTVVKTGFFNFNEITQNYLLDLISNSDDWYFDDPAYANTLDSLSLKNWENGEIYLQSRGVESDNYYVIQFVSKDANSYTFKYASAQELTNVKTATISRDDDYNFIYFSFKTDDIITIDPGKLDWDLMFTPYLGWWETSVSEEFSPYIQSGALINNESGARIARIFDSGINYDDIDSTYINNFEYTDMKGSIGSNWKILGAIDSPNLYTMDLSKKYILKKYDAENSDTMYFKLQIVDYKMNGQDHFPTVIFKFLTRK